MPTLPTFENRAAPASPQPIFARPEAYGLEAANALTTLGAVTEKLQDAAARAEAIRSTAEAQQEWQGIIKKNDDEIGDHSKFVDDTSRAIQEAYNSRIAKATSRKARELIEQNLSDNLIGANVLIQDRGRSKLKDKAIGDFVEGSKQIINASVSSGGENLEGAYRMFGDLLGAMRANNFLTEQQTKLAAIKFGEDFDNARAGHLLTTNPKRLEALMAFDASIKPGSGEKKNFPSLDGGNLYTWGQRAKEMQRENDAAEAKVRREQIEKINREMLVGITAPGANLGLIRENVRKLVSEGKLDAAPGEHWIDQIDQMMAAKVRAAKEDNPYEKSDWETLAMVTRGILMEPEKWTQQRVLSYMGRGLSVRDAEKWANSVGREADPVLGQVMESLKYFRQQNAFLTADERKNANVDSMLQNNLRYMELVDKLTQRSGIGVQGRKEDPRKVMEELMQPYMNEHVKHVLSPSTWIAPSEATRKEEIEARQLMVRNGMPITPESLKKTIEMMRLEKGGLGEPKASDVPSPGASSRQPKTPPDELPITVEMDGKYYLIPQVVNGVKVSRESAIRQFDIGNNPALGVFNTADEAAKELKARTQPASPAQSAGRQWSIKDAAKIEREFMTAFNRPLPVSAYGQSSTHNQMGFNHENGMDIALPPESIEGRFLINYLKNNGIPFLAFNSAVPGQSTGPHIHVGPPSPRKK